MSTISNHRFPKVFAFNPATELIAGAAVKPSDLTPFQVGFFNAKTQLGATTAPTPLTAPVMIIHQNLGDNRYGTTRSRPFSVHSVRKWHAQKAAVAVDQITYVGYDEVDGTKTLTAYYGQVVELVITIHNNELRKWYGAAGYTQRIVLDIARCAPCIADCTLMDPDSIADYFVAYINSTGYPAGNFPTGLELSNWVTASKVATGTQGNADRRVGIKIVGDPIPIELLDKCNPQQFYKVTLTTFVVGVPYNCPNFPITTTVKAKAGNGYPLESADYEKESQGYDRVRDQFEDVKYMKTNFIVRAVDATKYDFYYLEFDWTHADSGQPKNITDPYIIIFPVPTGTGGPLEVLINAWVTPLGFDAVTIAASTGKGSGVPQVNG